MNEWLEMMLFCPGKSVCYHMVHSSTAYFTFFQKSFGGRKGTHICVLKYFFLPHRCGLSEELIYGHLWLLLWVMPRIVEEVHQTRGCCAIRRGTMEQDGLCQGCVRLSKPLYGLQSLPGFIRGKNMSELKACHLRSNF